MQDETEGRTQSTKTNMLGEADGRMSTHTRKERRVLLLLIHTRILGTNGGFNCQLQSVFGMIMYTNKWRTMF